MWPGHLKGPVFIVASCYWYLHPKSNQTHTKNFINCYQLIKITNIKKFLSPGILIITEFCFMRIRNTKKSFSFYMHCSWSIFVAAKRATRSFIPSDLLWGLFLHLFPRSVTLLYILLHLDGDSTMRLERSTLLLWPELFLCCKLAKKDLKPKLFLLVCLFSYYFVYDCKRNAGYDKMTE